VSDDPAGRAPAATTLREYLADRDVPCHQCGYNLRGAQDVFCPECNAVIPRPPSEQIARAAMNPAELKLWCPDCDYVVTGVNARECPECGEKNLVRFINQRPPAPRRRWFRPRGVPVPIWLNGVAATVVFVAYGFRIAMRAAGKGRPLPLDEVSALVSGSLIPVAIAALWVIGRSWIRRWSDESRRLAAGIGFISGLGWVFVIALLR
jgi:Zn finger protein HypA/HybF involved in hydrogenase expression